MKTFFSLVLLIFFIVGCASKNAPLADLSLPQDANFYIEQNKDMELSPEALKELKENYLKTWFSPWTTMEVNKNTDEVFWVAPSLLKSPGYGENLKKNTLEYTSKIYEDMDIPNYPSVSQKAIITTDTSVRAVPTEKPRYSTPKGYPFDRWQNSLIFQGTPVLITHYDLSKQWAHIQSSFVYGWVKVTDIAKIHQKDIDYLLSIKNYVVPDKDKIPLYDSKGNFLTNARVGEIFALKPSEKAPSKNSIASKAKKNISEKMTKEVYTYKKNIDGYVVLIPVSIEGLSFSPFPKKMDMSAMASIINSMIGERYGWGGSLENRDCSAFTRDSFANFGILLPRNSAAQVKYAGNMIDLSKMDAKQKEQYIIDHATPFATILWLKGHIMLYIGTYKGRAMAAHNAWSITTSTLFSKQENILGGVVITTLWVGKEKNGSLFKSKMLIDRILGMSDLYDFASKEQESESVK
ncbi:SH3 domain-containing C40 family peptidase [Helicobacter cappadocius]|uniref:SH3 domain-containing protein n=1 Tax=Helicobacter cappadocius TaxID=3063998 RepID=A0AA90TFF2_9HELI|nr:MULTISPECIES: SH3 domain-containing C40 family peptidase [unclassified Helicobacter]MDO7253642.1 SH3 domain-containing protein [Helicobacter sp. faydin-H75]MDP2539570.1 SH3 domain-containing protein [Helicobacter sp. faydin-H76]